MPSVNFRSVPVEICNDCPQIGKHPRLLLVLLLYALRILKYLPVLSRQKLSVVLPHDQFLYAIDQLVLFCNLVLGGNYRIQSSE